MIEKRIKLINVEDKSKFLKVTNSLPYDIDIRYGGSMYDGKSSMAVMAIDASEGVRVRIHTDDSSVIDCFKKWICEV